MRDRKPWDPQPRGPVQTVLHWAGLTVLVAVSAVAELVEELRRG